MSTKPFDRPVEATNPGHYRKHPSGVECITIVEHMSFCAGNAVKYIWRADHKSTTPIEDLEKAKWYIEKEIDRLRPLHAETDKE